MCLLTDSANTSACARRGGKDVKEQQVRTARRPLTMRAIKRNPRLIHRTVRILSMVILSIFLVKFWSMHTSVMEGLTIASSDPPRSPDSFDYSVYVLVSEKRAKTTERNLRQLVPYKTVPAVERRRNGFSVQDTATKADWDWLDRRMRGAYIVQPVEPGEAGCILGHRRLLEEFLQDSQKDVALILEDDAVPIRRKAVLSHLDQVVEAMDEIYLSTEKDWDFVQLGRCWDINCHKESAIDPLATLSGDIHIYPSQGFELCSHAYLVSRKGAEKILQYTIPFVLPYDLTVMLLARNGLLNAFFTSKNFFNQDESEASLIRDYVSTKPVCYPDLTPYFADLKVRRTRNYDPVLLGRIQKSTSQEKLSVETRRLAEASTVEDAEAGRQRLVTSLCQSGKKRFCTGISKLRLEEEIHSMCQILGGEGEAMYQEADEASKEFIDEMNKADLDGVIVWGLRQDAEHTHKHIHSGIHKAAQEALAYSQRPRHLCYVPENTVLDLGRHVYQNSTSGKLARSLVFASPKHMAWSDDPGFVMLPIEDTSRYVFHGEVPRPHTVLKRSGLAVEWETWGPDGWIPDIDSDAFQRGSPWQLDQNCVVDSMKKTKRCADSRTMVQPWAAKSTPSEIEANKLYVTERAKSTAKQTVMHFQGSIWDCNIDNVLKFIRGCAQEKVEVIRYGNNLDSQTIMFSRDDLREDLFEEHNFFMEQSNQSLKELFEEKAAPYAPSFQGACHFAPDPSESYIADRVLNLIAIGEFPMTNNPASYQLLGYSPAIVFDTNVTNLCRRAAQHHRSAESLYALMDVVKREHTYVSRLISLLQFIDNDATKTVWPESGAALARAPPTAPIEILDTASLRVALKECKKDFDCVLARIPVHPNRNCSSGLHIGSHHRMGTGLAGALKNVLPCDESNIALRDHMLSDDYEVGRPVIHFVRDPLETVVSGYQYHTSSNDSWLVTSGKKEKLLAAPLKNGLEKEFHYQALYQIESAVGLYGAMKENSTTQQDFFTVRIDDIRTPRMFDLTTQAIQIWLGISPRISWKELEECCFWPKHITSDKEKPSLRQEVMARHGTEIYNFRKKLDFPEIGLERWKAPPAVRLVPAFLIGGTAILATLCIFAGFSRWASVALKGRKKGSNGASASSSYLDIARALWAQGRRELAWETPMFSVHDPVVGADLDIQESFAPTFGKSIRKTQLLRAVLFVWSLQVFWFDIQAVRFPWFYFAFLSQAGFALNIGYFFVSLCVSFTGPLKQPARTGSQRPSLLVCIQWAYFAATITCQFIVTTVHWATNLHFFLNVLPARQRYPSLMKHGIFFLLTLWEGQYYSRIPLRAKHYLFPFLVLMLYAAWTCYQSNFGPSNPFFYGQDHEWDHPDDDDAVYPQLNWSKRPGQSSMSVVYGLIFAPLHFIVLWLISNWNSSNQSWDGKHRRFMKKSLP